MSNTAIKKACVRKPMEKERTKHSKVDVINHIAAKNDLLYNEAAEMYQMVLSSLQEIILNGDRVSLPRFGTFCLQIHKGHRVRFTDGNEAIDDYPVLRFQVSDVLANEYRASFKDGTLKLPEK